MGKEKDRKMKKVTSKMMIKELTKEVLKDPKVKEALDNALEEAHKRMKQELEKKQREFISKFDSSECNHTKMNWNISRDIILKRLYLYGKCDECFQYGEEILCKDSWSLKQSLLWSYTNLLSRN